MKVTALYLVVCVSLLGNANVRWFSLPWLMCTGKYSARGPCACASSAGGMVTMSYSRADSRALFSSLLLSSSPSSLGIHKKFQKEKEKGKEEKKRKENEAFSHSFSFPFSFSVFHE